MMNLKNVLIFFFVSNVLLDSPKSDIYTFIACITKKRRSQHCLIRDDTEMCSQSSETAHPGDTNEIKTKQHK